MILMIAKFQEGVQSYLETNENLKVGFVRITDIGTRWSKRLFRAKLTEAALNSLF